MYSKLSGRFFISRIPKVYPGQRRIHLQDLNYVPDILDEIRKQKLKENIVQLEKNIEKKEHELINLKIALDKDQQELDTLLEPYNRYIQASDAFKNMTALITKGVYQSLINGSLSTTDGPLWGYDAELLDIFKKILSSYQMTLSTSSRSGQGEIANYLHIGFPWNFKTVLPLDRKTKYDELLISFDKQLELTYKKANAKIDEDFALLKRELLEPVKDGHLKAISRSQPCTVAYERFIRMADISISRQGSVIIGEKKSPEENRGLGLRS